MGRGRGKKKKEKNRISEKRQVIGIETDILFPLPEQQFLAAQIPGAAYTCIHSAYGHDGFLLEYESIGQLISDFLIEKKDSENTIESINSYGNT